MPGLFRRRGSQLCLWSFQLPRLFPTPLESHTDPAVRRASTCPALFLVHPGRSSSRARHPDACRRGADASPHLPARRPYRYQSAGRCGGCAKPVPRRPSRAPTLEAAAPLSSRAPGAGSAGREGVSAGRPGSRPEADPLGGEEGGAANPADPATPCPGRRHPAARERSGAARGGRSFPRTGLPGRHGRSLFLERESTPEEGSRGSGPARGGAGGAERGREPRGARGEREPSRSAAGARGRGGKGRGGKKGASGARGRARGGRALTWGTRRWHCSRGRRPSHPLPGV